MPIPESRLSGWSDHGPQQKSIRTHETIRRALDNHRWPAGMSYDFYLQGSYRNDTNVIGDSDVDVLLELNSVVRYDSSSLAHYDQDRLSSSFQPPTYSWEDFRREAFKALQGSFGKDRVSQGNKSIKLRGAARRLAADIVVCMEYRKYTSISSYVQGMAFKASQDGHWVVNYPKHHISNGAEKSRQTRDRYKRTVRMFKNARNHLETTGQIGSKLAPSYFLECLLHNAPDWTYQNGFQGTYCAIANWINQTDLERLVCQNGQQYLFGQTDEQWSVLDARTLGNQLANLWNNWS